MKTSICTLFEGNYHYGVAALANSLYQQGFKGDIFIGYRGGVPSWVRNAKYNSKLVYKNAKTLIVNDNLSLHFLPLTTNYSLTNYKPDFLLDLFENSNLEIENLFYFDPDITLNKHWNHFLQWLDAGVALCEDVNSPVPQYHPRRTGWRQFYKESNLELCYKSDYYVNGGFIGLRKTNIQFLRTWKLTQELMAQKIGGLERSIFSQGNQRLNKKPGFNIFGKTDQDALNAAVEATNVQVSIIGKEAMGFKNGNNLMFHCLGAPKPWNMLILRNTLLKGSPPKAGFISYWKYANYPIKTYNKSYLRSKKLALYMSKFISRFYKN